MGGSRRRRKGDRKENGAKDDEENATRGGGRGAVRRDGSVGILEGEREGEKGGYHYRLLLIISRYKRASIASQGEVIRLLVSFAGRSFSRGSYTPGMRGRSARVGVRARDRGMRALPAAAHARASARGTPPSSHPITPPPTI